MVEEGSQSLRTRQKKLIPLLENIKSESTPGTKHLGNLGCYEKTKSTNRNRGEEEVQVKANRMFPTISQKNVYQPKERGSCQGTRSKQKQKQTGT